MNKKRIKPSSVIKAFASYVALRTKRVLHIKDNQFDHLSIDVHPDTETIWVWVHGKERILGRAQFYFDGRCYSKVDFIEESKLEKDEKNERI